MRSNNELQMMNELIHYMGVQSAMQGKKKKKKDTDALSLFITPIELLHTEHSH